MDLQLKGKRVLITGGSKGIGLACAEILAEEGCALHLAARGEAALSAAKGMLASRFGTDVTIHPLDLSNGDQARALAEHCKDIDILINNAGAIPAGNIWEIEESRWREAWDLKVFGFINLCRAVYPNMKTRGSGVIINIIGAAGNKPNRDYIAGGAGNAALMALTRAMGAKSLRDGIRVVGINPGFIITERLETQMRRRAETRFGDPGRWQEVIPKDPPPGEPRDIANMAAFLASDLGKYVTGTTITVDGGSTAD
ncbi:MAG: short-chain dehydrogenase/reductase [bacterium]